MLTYIARRLLIIIPMAIGISFLIYLALDLSPGDAVTRMLNPVQTVDPARIEERGRMSRRAALRAGESRFLDRQDVALRALREAKGVRGARGNRDGAGRRDMARPPFERDIRRAFDEQQELEQAVVAVLGNLPAIALAAAADVLDVNELRRHGARFAIEGKYRYGRLRLSAGLPHSCYCSAHNDDVLDVMFERKIQKMTRVVHFAAGRMLAKT